MADIPAFIQQQYQFSSFIRRPQQPLPEGTAAERMALYRELFFNNIRNFLADNFPVLRRCMSAENWLELVDGFYAEHTSQTPHFCEIPEEFLQYLQHERQPQSDDLPFMLELAHYEWVEMALAIKQADTPCAVLCQQSAARLTTESRLIVAETAWPLAYHFPVHQITPEKQPECPPEQPTCLIVYRNVDEKVTFLSINPVTWRLLELIKAYPQNNLAWLIAQLATELELAAGQIGDHAIQICRDMLQRGVLQQR